MTNTDVVLAQIRATPRLTDAELVQRTGIRPHQQVNAICNRLQARGLVRRTPGPAGTTINIAVDGQPVAEHRPQAASVQLRPRMSSSDRLLTDIAQLNPATTLLVVPCSGTKAEGGTATKGIGLGAVLESSEGHALLAARKRVRRLAGIDERRLMPAAERYTGGFYEVAGGELRQAVHAGTYSIILSGGYGALLPDEPIGTYDAAFHTAWWPDDVVGRSVAAYARQQRLRSLVAFLAKSTDYAKVLRAIDWSAYGIDSYLVSPDMAGAGGAMRAVPVALGEAFVAFRQHRLQPGWRSRSGLGLLIERLS